MKLYKKQAKQNEHKNNKLKWVCLKLSTPMKKISEVKGKNSGKVNLTTRIITFVS